MDKWELQREISYLESLRDDMKSISANFSSASSSLEKANSKLKNNYTVELNDNNGVRRINKLRNNIGKEVSMIESSVIPEIDAHISRNKAEIRRIEEEERRRKEEEERAKAEKEKAERAKNAS